MVLPFVVPSSPLDLCSVLTIMRSTPAGLTLSCRHPTICWFIMSFIGKAFDDLQQAVLAAAAVWTRGEVLLMRNATLPSSLVRVVVPTNASVLLRSVSGPWRIRLSHRENISSTMFLVAGGARLCIRNVRFVVSDGHRDANLFLAVLGSGSATADVPDDLQTEGFTDVVTMTFWDRNMFSMRRYAKHLGYDIESWRL
mmetsp:Transcript_71657/g.231904  ORF Transcript_71657/g.231904 Transcript_71657/m.231904 type:complete len:197 (-) Transcript_71657:120-710(-)